MGIDADGRIESHTIRFVRVLSSSDYVTLNVRQVCPLINRRQT